MKCLDRYIAGDFSKKFLLFFIVLNTFLFFEDAYAHFEKFLASDESLRHILVYYVAYGTTLLPLTMPLAFVIALTFSFSMMHRNNETLLLLSSGISFFRLTRVFWFFGIIASFVSLMGNFYWIPRARAYANRYLERLEVRSNDEKALVVKHLTLNGKNRLWYINRYDKNTACALGIAIYDRDAQGVEYRRIMAQSGYFEEETKAWTLKQGREILFHPKTGVANESHVFEQRTFTELNASPKLMLLLQLPVSSLSLPQLKEAIAYENQEKIPGNISYKIQFWNIILSSIFCFFSCWVALPLLLTEPREMPLRGIAKLSIILTLYSVMTYTLFTLGINGALHWSLTLLLPVTIALWLPFPWILSVL
ncbi:MAG: LptF/LptG family permease [Puniceicoccales bacterium]|jgi:lipopolysaccharide export LptBFGC system permease protein LptF|nr:LptF/LptG family permease [Puniceicoccales bacterium]